MSPNDRRLGGAAAIDRALALLTEIAEGNGTPLREHARKLNLPMSTAYRMVDALRAHGLVHPANRGAYVLGLGLMKQASTMSAPQVLAAVARRPLRQLAKSMKATAHLGILEDDMITYVVKEHGGGRRLFTRENGQLEAYCSAIGKMLLAHLPDHEREAYLAGSPFIQLTSHTVTEPDEIRRALELARSHGYAIDDREIAEDLFCVAVPIRDNDGQVRAAISLSTTYDVNVRPEPPAALLDCAAIIESRLKH